MFGIFSLLFGTVFKSFQTYLYLAIMLLGVSLYFYYNHTQKVEQGLQTQITLDKVALSTQALIIKNLKEDIANIQAINDQLAKLNNLDDIQKDKLTTSLEKLNNISSTKAKVLEKIVNQATKNRLRCLSLASGAVPLKNEVNAVCPQLVPNVNKGK